MIYIEMNNLVKTTKLVNNNNIIQIIQNKTYEAFIKNDIFNKCITKKGQTQNAERQYIPIITKVLDDLHLEYEQASSQKPKDIRIKNPPIYLEAKKTDKTTIILNDTLPSKDTYYLYILTGTKKYKPQLKIINGQEFIKDNEWYLEYLEDIKKIKDKYCRGENRLCKTTALKAYIRPTFSVDLKHFNLLTY